MADNAIVVGIGPAGTGKTYLAVAAAVDALTRKRVRRIVLARPAVEAGESLGFLPGDMQAKVDPYLRPLYDALDEMMPFERIQRALETRTIEIAPLAFMRGRTLADAFVIVDEARAAGRASERGGRRTSQVAAPISRTARCVGAGARGVHLSALSGVAGGGLSCL